ncbi:probable cytochrome P450 6a13 [Diprion similis]|uniref:probable cytochrome P450 6a13 n=1 Tax=Diprion similis TaxID=362088 RepID=UPI001EF8F7B5|nr:probable cytochrome P450 6a13 [Diprion similis]
MALFSVNLALQLLGIIIAIVCAAYIYLKHVAYNYWSSRGIAQLEPIVPIGDLWPLLSGKRSIGQLMRDGYFRLRKKRIFGIYSFHKPNLVICDPDVLRFVLTKEFPRFQDRGMFSDEKLDPMSGNLFLTGGPKWRHLRVKFSPTFTSGKIKHMFTIVKEISDNLDKRLTYEAKQNDLVEIKDLMARFSTDVIATVAFGIDCNSLEDPDAEFRAWGRKFLEPNPLKNALMALCPSVLQTLKIPFFDKGASDFILNAFTDTVNYRTANNVVRRDFLQLAMQLINTGYVQGDDEDHKETTQNSVNAIDKITMLEGAAQAFAFWVGGFETSSSTATHCLYEMALNQDIQEKLSNEINTVLEKFRGLTYDSISEMTYLHKVVSETLRKYPSVPILNRECNQDTKLLDTGLVVEKGTPILIPVMGIHWDPDIYPSPEKFDPERFTEENIAKRHRYAYLAFGEGPRNCIGMRFGYLQTKIGLITLLSKYRFKPGPDTKVPLPADTGNFLHMPLGGVMLRVEERN